MAKTSTPPPTPPGPQPVAPADASQPAGLVAAARVRLTRFRRLDRYRHMPWWLRWIKRVMIRPESLKDTWIYRLLGGNVLRRECWSLRPASAAMGAAIGMFVMLTPTIGIQTPIAIALCVPLGGNIPLSLVAVFISNPLTMVPVFGFNLYLGCRMLGIPFPKLYGKGSLTEAHPDFVELTGVLLRDYSWPMWLGSLVVATIAATMSYAIIYYLAMWARRVHLVESIKERAEKARLRQLKWKEARLARLEERAAERLAHVVEARERVAQKVQEIEAHIERTGLTPPPIPVPDDAEAPPPPPGDAPRESPPTSG